MIIYNICKLNYNIYGVRSLVYNVQITCWEPNFLNRHLVFHLQPVSLRMSHFHLLTQRCMYSLADDTLYVTFTPVGWMWARIFRYNWTFQFDWLSSNGVKMMWRDPFDWWIMLTAKRDTKQSVMFFSCEERKGNPPKRVQTKDREKM